MMNLKELKIMKLIKLWIKAFKDKHELMNILKGYTNLITKQNQVLAKERMKVCISCKDRKGLFCGICGCLLEAKTTVEDEKCKLDKWKA
jgi:hypothetical protein